MKSNIIGIIGEYDENKKSHVMLNRSLDWLKSEYEFEYKWIETTDVEEKNGLVLSELSGIWSASGSPFKSLSGAIKAIEYARITNIPFLGTCGGFQHAIIEYARNVLGIIDAQHEEYNKESTALFISQLACSLAGKTMKL